MSVLHILNKMNEAMKIFLETACTFPRLQEKRDAALDIIYEKLTIIPIQKAWRSKTLKDSTINSSNKRHFEENTIISDCVKRSCYR
jgi:hypothetical protein